MFRFLTRSLVGLLALTAPALAFDLQSTTTPGNAPPALPQGEIAINHADKTLFFKNVDGSIERGSLLNAVPAGRTAVELGDASGLSVTASGGSTSRSLSDAIAYASGNTATIATLRALATAPIPANAVMNVAGYYAIADGGGGTFVWSPTSTAAEDSGTVISPNAALSTGRWLRTINGPLTLRQMGAKGDFNPTTVAGTDDSAAIQAWINACYARAIRCYAEGGRYQTGPITAPGLVHVQGAGLGATQFYRKPTGLTATLGSSASTLTVGATYGVRVQALDAGGALVADLGVAVLSPTAGTPSISVRTSAIAGAAKFRLWLSDVPAWYAFTNGGYWEVAGSQLSDYVISGTLGTTAGAPSLATNTAIFNGVAVPLQGSRTRQWPSFSDMSVFGSYQPAGSAAIRGASSAFAYVNGQGGRAAHYTRIYAEGFYDAAFRNEGAVEGYYNQTTVEEARYGYYFDGTSHDHWSAGAQVGLTDEGVVIAAGAAGHRHQVNSYSNHIANVRDSGTRTIWLNPGLDRSLQDGFIVDAGAVGTKIVNPVFAGNSMRMNGVWSDIVLNNTDETVIESPSFAGHTSSGAATVAYNLRFNNKAATVLMSGETLSPGTKTIAGFANNVQQVARPLRAFGQSKQFYRKIVGEVPFTQADTAYDNLSQGSFGFLRKNTTSPVANALTADGRAVNGPNTLQLDDNSTAVVTAEVVAHRPGTTDRAIWTVRAAVTRDSGAASTMIIGSPSLTQIAVTNGAAGWALGVSADTTQGGLRFDVTGGAYTIYWGCSYRLTRVNS